MCVCFALRMAGESEVTGVTVLTIDHSLTERTMIKCRSVFGVPVGLCAVSTAMQQTDQKDGTMPNRQREERASTKHTH